MRNLNIEKIQLIPTYWSIKVIGHSKALLLSHFLEATTASVNSVFREEKYDWQDKEGEEA